MYAIKRNEDYRMKTTDTSEKGLEALIEASLIDEAKYERGDPNNYDREFCLDRPTLFRFLQATQPKSAERVGIGTTTNAEDKFLKRLYDQIQTRGIVDVLRNGIKDRDVTITLYYPKPASSNNPTAAKQYASNIFTVTRQLHFSNDKKALSLDMVIFINGLPLITFELKNNLTKQNVQHAIRQYQTDRDPKEPLFGFARCLVHFAVDDDLVYMATHLRGSETNFLPFNLGDRGGAGNPVNPHGLKTDYLWKRTLAQESLSTIIEKFAQIVEEVDEDTGKKKKKLIFPRYHQLDVVQKLLADARANGVGHCYLIQHSAGSGKSNSISWLAHQLVELTDATETRPMFDSIVVTDRVVLDKQIRDTVKQFEYVKGVVEAITEGSGQLCKALEEGKKIIITTIQKFPFVVKDIQALGDKRFAILIDEAHSSQSGRAAAAMNTALGRQDMDEEEETVEDRINRIIEEQKLLTNASYFAFTATPKNKTLEVFGARNPADGKFYPFHSYAMRQAIEEEFILDVLAHYTTYQSYYKLLKKVEDDPQFDSKRAKKKLKKYVEGHPAAIRQKTEIMVDHFYDEVIAKRKIDGKAKAMVVTSSIVNAIQYKLAFDDYLRKSHPQFKALVAFTGSKEVDGREYTEAKMNGFPSADIPKEFKKSENRFLIVAEKFQTGFDQPLLHTMYVDKVLTDVRAVQTLSRLNRAYKPYKTDTFVLDFVNSADTIKEAFKPFYETTILSEATDVNRLNDLQDALDAFQVYSRQDVDALMARYVSGAPRDQLDPILNKCAQTYKQDLDDDKQIDFKAQAKTFVRTYQFLALILPFNNPYWESLRTFLRLLIPKLRPPDDQDLAKGVLESVDMDSYRVEQEAMVAIKLQGGQELAPTPAQPRAGRETPEMDYLSNIVREFNERWGTDWTNADRVRRFLFEDLPQEVGKDEEYQNAKSSGDQQNARITYVKKIEDKFQDHIFDQTELYRKFTEEPEFKKWLVDRLFAMDYRQAAVQASV
jgi:type I restriction enzyme R subunit